MDADTLEAIPADRVTMVEIPALAICSTDCRERKRRGEPVWYLVPDGVVQYIAKHDLYGHRRTVSPMTATDHAVELVVTAARAAADKLASQIVAFDVSDQLAITDAFLIASGSNDRQVKAIVDEVEDKLREIGRQAAAPRGRARRPLGADRLRRDRRARPARGGAAVLRPRAALARLPGHRAAGRRRLHRSR